MKLISLRTIQIVVLLIAYNAGYSQANTTLSNLVSPTNINNSLLPNASNTLDLGSTARNWRNIYTGTAYYLKNFRIIQAPGTTNFFVGQGAGNSATTGDWNTSLGQSTLIINTSGYNNTAIGYATLINNTDGYENTGVGAYAMRSNSSGYRNSALGYQTLFSNTTGAENTAVGFRSLWVNSTGEGNTAVGSQALNGNSNGSGNVAVGTWALLSSNGSGNTAVGTSSLSGNLTGNDNTAIGNFSLNANNTGYENAALGKLSLFGNTSGFRNTATGYESLYTSTVGSYNNASGYRALYSSTTSSYNTASGAYALYSNTAASHNSAFGANTLYANTTGGYNTALGRSALQYNTTGSMNSAIGFNAGPSINNLTNTSALGYNARPTASNQIMLGNSAVTSIMGAGSFVIYSDGRFKKEINENVPGIEFIKLLKPVTYHYDIRGLDKKTGAAKAPPTTDDGSAAQAQQLENAAIDAKEKKWYTGFVAQDVEAAAQKLNFEFSGIYKPQSDNDVYGLSYSDFVVPLVKAVQELSNNNDSLQQLVLSLEDRIARMESILKINGSSSLKLTDASIAQNSPNPFKGSTIITYNLPQQGFNNAQVIVYDATGKRLRMFNLSGQGRGTVNIDATALPAGTYQYSLVVNGNIIDTKKMVLVK